MIVGTTRIIETKDTVNNSGANVIQFSSLSSVPADCKIKYAGVVATKDATKQAALKNVRVTENTELANGAILVRGQGVDKHNAQVNWKTPAIQGNETWYVSAYLVYTDSKNVDHFVVGDEVVAKSFNS